MAPGVSKHSILSPHGDFRHVRISNVRNQNPRVYGLASAHMVLDQTTYIPNSYRNESTSQSNDEDIGDTALWLMKVIHQMRQSCKPYAPDQQEEYRRQDEYAPFSNPQIKSQKSLWREVKWARQVASLGSQAGSHTPALCKSLLSICK